MVHQMTWMNINMPPKVTRRQHCETIWLLHVLKVVAIVAVGKLGEAMIDLVVLMTPKVPVDGRHIVARPVRVLVMLYIRQRG